MSIVPEAGDSFDIEHYREPALRLDATVFARLHGAAFLLLSGDRAGPQVPDGLARRWRSTPRRIE